ncbi:hypothetical protein DXG03_006987 [Asterophora parasitica]|uniref:Peroxisomal membrane protein PEX16 n=1 Tax=Asterophora parasitica TaxID=117018 RepID=A0A9P7KEW9_9AGAR|nr:hypothetical protein DXG03_006987 [Asterophora parasitica]
MSSSIARYEAFLINNVSTISSLESSLRSITWFLPGRFKDAELASEALSTSLNVMSMYHDTLLARIVQANPKHRPLIPASLHTRFTRACSEKDTKYKWAARALQLIKFTELVIEMGLRRRVSSKARWRGIVLLEAIKAIIRFILLRVNRKPLLSPPIPERDFDPMSLPPSSNASSPTLAPSSPAPSLPATPDHLRNNHMPLPQHSLISNPSESSVEQFLLPKAMTTSSVKPSLSLVKTLSSPQDWVAESIHILRPLVYVSLLVSDRRSNRPLITALIMELLSRNLRRTPPPSAALERAEYARRDRDMLWYLFRGSIWQSYTRPKLEAFATRASRAPLLGLFGAFVQDWIPLIDEYHYYNSSREDGATRKIDDPVNHGLVHPGGTNFRSTDLAPGAITPMHRTSSLDYNSLVHGELILIMEDGTEKHLKDPGDTVVQKGTLHAWRNPSRSWARWVTVLIAAEPAIVKGKALASAFLPLTGNE